MGSHPRLGRISIIQRLPIDLLRYILLFIKEPRFPLLYDLGSMCGTYVKVSHMNPVELTQGLNFLVGSDINIEVDRVCNDFLNIESNPETTISDFSSSLKDREGPFIIGKVNKIYNDNEATVQSMT